MRGNQRGVPPGYDPEGHWFRGWSPFFTRPGGLLGRGAHVGFEAARRAAIRARRAETGFAVQLRHIARHIGNIIGGLYTPNPPEWHRISESLDTYEQLITPWARAAAARQLAEISRRDAASWHEIGRTINRALGVEITSAPIQPVLNELLAAQIELITSLPRAAKEEIRDLTVAAMTAGTRWEELVPWIKDRLIATGGNALARANLIARTETGRAATMIQAGRAQFLGSEGYVWRTARDRDVRPRHRELEGTFHRWDDPPVATDPGQREVRAHPGAIYNCRCFPEVVLPGEEPRLGQLPRNPAYLESLRAQGYTTGTAFE
jgi:SPP1 gp7 family putative phage head morphogenesis protein